MMSKTNDFLPADVARVFDEDWAPMLRWGGEARAVASLSAIASNLYRWLPPGDYAIRDIREAVLALFRGDK
jgi:hypothetical protein